MYDETTNSRTAHTGLARASIGCALLGLPLLVAFLVLLGGAVAGVLTWVAAG